jgi:hypothetical protein
VWRCISRPAIFELFELGVRVAINAILFVVKAQQVTKLVYCDMLNPLARSDTLGEGDGSCESVCVRGIRRAGESNVGTELRVPAIAVGRLPRGLRIDRRFLWKTDSLLRLLRLFRTLCRVRSSLVARCS